MTEFDTPRSAVLSDLGYLRDLAEGGQNAPLLGGRFLVWWGILVPLAYVGHYLISTGQFGAPGLMLGWMWAMFSVVGLAGQFVMMWLFPKDKPGAYSAGNRASEYVFMAAGFALFAFFVGVIASSILNGTASEGFAWSVPLALSLYGVGQLVSGLMTNIFALKLAGFAAFAGVALTAALVSTAMIWLVAAGIVVVALLVPGLMLLRREPAEIV